MSISLNWPFVFFLLFHMMAFNCISKVIESLFFAGNVTSIPLMLASIELSPLRSGLNFRG